MQFLITTFTDSIGHTHSHVTKAKDNQTFTVVEADSKEEVEEISLISSDKNKASVRKLMKIQRILG